MKKPIIKVINKTKDSVTLVLNGRTLKTDWDTFNEGYEWVDRTHCTPTDELFEQNEKVQELIGQIIAYIIMGNNEVNPEAKMKTMYMIGHLSEELQKLLGCSNDEVLAMVKSRMDDYQKERRREAERIARSIERKFRPKSEEEIQKEKKKHMEEARTIPTTATQSLGDVKGMDELKKQFGL